MISQVCGGSMRKLLFLSAGVIVSGGMELHRGPAIAGECCLCGLGKERPSVSAACRPDWGYSPTLWQRFAAASVSGDFVTSEMAWGPTVFGAEQVRETRMADHGAIVQGMPSPPASIFPRHHLSRPQTERPGGTSQAPAGAFEPAGRPTIPVPDLPSAPPTQSSPESSGQSRYQSPSYLPVPTTVLRDRVSIRQVSRISAPAAVSQGSATARYGAPAAIPRPALAGAETAVPTASSASGPIRGRYLPHNGTSVHHPSTGSEVSQVIRPVLSGGRYGGR